MTYVPDILPFVRSPDIIPPLSELGEGRTMAFADRRYIPYQRAFLCALSRWMTETDASVDTMQEMAFGLQSAIQQIYELHRAKIISEGPRSLGEILDEVVNDLLAKSRAKETRQ